MEFTDSMVYHAEMIEAEREYVERCRSLGGLKKGTRLNNWTAEIFHSICKYLGDMTSSEATELTNQLIKLSGGETEHLDQNLMYQILMSDERCARICRSHAVGSWEDMLPNLKYYYRNYSLWALYFKRFII